jgi:hypothetical protein
MELYDFRYTCKAKPQQEDIERNRKEGTSSFKKRKELASQGRGSRKISGLESRSKLTK